MNILQANRQWASRPDDERYTSLNEMLRHFQEVRLHSRALVTSTKQIELKSLDKDQMALYGKSEVGYAPTNWSFGQLSVLANAPASYLRSLPSKMACECINYGLKKREDGEVGILLHKNDDTTLRGATGPRYGRIWNADVTKSLVSKFGNGVDGQWKVPGEFGKKLSQVTKANTTLYASDRDMWVFLADEENRIDFAGRKLARGFFVWNSEVGAATFGLGTFLFDYVCQNRIIWGAAEYKEIKMRHTLGAPERFLSEVKPTIERYASSSTQSVTLAIKDARKDKLSDVDEFLAKRYGPRMVQTIKAVHQTEEHKPIETRWDVVVALTAHARTISHQDARVDLERSAGDLLNN